MVRPYYKKIAEELKRQGYEKLYPSDTFLPSESKLARIYNVNRVTVRNALRILSNERIIDSIPGKGLFVHPNVRLNFINNNDVDTNICFILSI